MNNLPTELTLNICQWLPLRDIICLKMTSSILNDKINSVAKALLLKISKEIVLEDVHILLCYYLQEYYDRIHGDVLKIYSDELKSHDCHIIIKNMILTHLSDIGTAQSIGTGTKSFFKISISKHKTINKLFGKILRFYINNDTLEDYDDQIELYFFYLLLQIDIFHSCKNVNVLVDTFSHFINSSSGDELNFEDTIKEYFEHIIKNNADVNFDSLHKLSKVYTTIPTIKKLFGSKYLDLSQSKLITCCSSCSKDNLQHIVQFKFNRPNDLFLSYNYRVIKMFLRQQNYKLFCEMEKFELYYINKTISVTHPYYLSKMHINSFYFKKYFYKLQFESSNRRTVTKLVSYINEQQRKLKTFYFS
jgi:hypothetical protein